LLRRPRSLWWCQELASQRSEYWQCVRLNSSIQHLPCRPSYGATPSIHPRPGQCLVGAVPAVVSQCLCHKRNIFTRPPSHARQERVHGCPPCTSPHFHPLVRLHTWVLSSW
jgi:hypothetical protein